MKPAIITLSPVPTCSRVEMFPSVASPGVGVGVAVGVGVGVAVGVGVGVGVGLDTVTVPTIPQHCPCGVQ